MRVALAARREEALREVAERVVSGGGQALVQPIDVRDRAQIEALMDAARERFGRIDILLADAGMGYAGPFPQVTDEQMVQTVETNLLGVMRCARAVLPVMIEQKRGHIITVSSVAAELASPDGTVYAATKAGIHRFSEGLRRSVKRYGIQVTDVLPGVIDTPMTVNLKGAPKAPVEVVVRAILGVMRRPCRSVVAPGWYQMAIALNRLAPGVMDWILERGMMKREDVKRET
jgi:NADP-dependent 3-hydroxy acid dehydrogenase YdfG